MSLPFPLLRQTDSDGLLPRFYLTTGRRTERPPFVLPHRLLDTWHPASLLQNASLNLGAVSRLPLNLCSPIHMGRLQTVTSQTLISIHVFRPATLRSINTVRLPLTRRHSSSRKADVGDTAPETALHIQLGMNLTMFHVKQSTRCTGRNRQQSKRPAHHHQTTHDHARPDR